MIKIKLKPNQKLFLISDPHYSHSNICAGLSKWKGTRKERLRPFDTIESMNNNIVNNINHNIGQNDYLVCLGDWSFGGIENIIAFRKRIVCENIFLVFGNHDHHIIRNKENVQSLFSWCGHYLDLIVVMPKERKNDKTISYHFICTHYPMASWDQIGKGTVYHLFGHLHMDSTKKIQAGKSMDVGIDGNNLKPYDMLEIVNLLKYRPNRPTIIAFEDEHHLL